MGSFWSEENKANSFLKFMPPLKQKLYKKVADILKERQAINILDFGCGNGNQLEFLNDNIKIGLYDINKAIAKETFSKYAQSKNVFLIENINEKTTPKFNALIVNMVWMCLKGEVEVNEFLKQLKQLKQENGIIILSMTHPCFRDELFSYYHTAFTTSEKLFDYTKEGDAFDVVIKNEEHSVFTDYHYSLTFFFKKMKEFEFEMIDFVELWDEEYNLTVNKRFAPYILTILK
jgi:2-polyprenyl-3-methyl-5-hydroxy-6-metoxy-1,4-benzoquinol methylase